MAEIEDVLDKLDDVLDAIADVKEDTAELVAKNEIWQICTACAGTGLKIEVTNEIPAEVTCSLCNGTKKIKWGTQEEGE